MDKVRFQLGAEDQFESDEEENVRKDPKRKDSTKQSTSVTEQRFQKLLYNVNDHSSHHDLLKPNHSSSSHRRRHNKDKKRRGTRQSSTIQEEGGEGKHTYADIVKELLGDSTSGHEPHPLFSEMVELKMDVWQETARWIRFEEDVEEGANRWSKPHVSSLSLHSLMGLRSYLQKGNIFLDMEANTLEEIVDIVLENFINNNQVDYNNRNFIKQLILQKHRHQFEGLRKVKSEAVIRKPSSSTTFETGFILNAVMSLGDMGMAISEMGNNSPMDPIAETMTNTHFMKKIPKGSEATNIMVGEVDCLDKPISAFIRLEKAVRLGDLTEVALPTRFIFLLLGPPVDPNSTDCYKEIGRSIGTSLADEVFHEVAYRARNREHLIMGLDEFLDSVTVLPPGEWDRNIRIEPPTSVPSQEARRGNTNGIPRVASAPGDMNHATDVVAVDEEEEKYNLRKEAGLVRSGRFCGGLINDIKRKKGWFFSDFKDAFSLQAVAVIFFLYFACLAPTIAFGGLLGQATKNRMASIESLVSGLTAGVVFALFSGQPLTIMGLTGPDLVFETLVFDFCDGQGWDYLSFRLWIGIWIAVILVTLVVTDASSLVCYITRFTEESFATLIAVIFIKKSFESIAKIATTHPYVESECFCDPMFAPTNWNSSMGAHYALLD